MGVKTVTELEIKQKVTRAGMCCFNYAGQVLLVSGKDKPSEWLLPKGHIEEGEESYEAAEREVREEAGVRALANPTMPVGYTIHNQGEEAIVTEWWIGLAQQRVAPSLELRQICWTSQVLALKALTYPEQRDVLRTALCHPEIDIDTDGDR